MTRNTVMTNTIQ